MVNLNTYPIRPSVRNLVHGHCGLRQRCLVLVFSVSKRSQAISGNWAIYSPAFMHTNAQKKKNEINGGTSRPTMTVMLRSEDP